VGAGPIACSHLHPPAPVGFFDNPADGCEANLTSSPTSRGACGTVCPSGAPSCGNSVCAP